MHPQKWHLSDTILRSFETAVETALQLFRVPGAAVALVTKTAMPYARGFGLRDLTGAQPVSPRTAFRVASLTKSLTSLMLATLVDDGLLFWDDRPVDIWPGFALPTAALTREVRLRDLLGMRTGIANMEPWIALYPDDLTPESLLAALRDLPVGAPLGTTFQYQDQLYAAAGYLAALATGAAPGELDAAFAALLQRRVFARVGMAGAALVSELPQFYDDYAVPYALDLAGRRVATGYAPLGGYAPAGAVAASVSDMAAFVQVCLRGGITTGGARVVTAQQLAATLTPQIAIGDELRGVYPYAARGSYGMGWIIAELAWGAALLGHNGGIDGFSSELGWLPGAEIGFVILNNLEPAYGGVLFNMAVRDTLLELLSGQPAQMLERLGAAHQQNAARIAALAASVQPISRDAVDAFLGVYERGWRVEWRAEGALRLTRNGRTFPVSALADGRYLISSGPLLLTQLAFSRDAAGARVLTLSDRQNHVMDTLVKLS